MQTRLPFPIKKYSNHGSIHVLRVSFSDDLVLQAAFVLLLYRQEIIYVVESLSFILQKKISLLYHFLSLIESSSSL